MMRALLVSILLWAPLASAQAPGGPPLVRATLIPEMRSVRDGRPLRLALRLVVAPGWHIYWTNPGESGLPTTVTWRVPAGFRVGVIEWPFPERKVVDGLTVHAYEGEVVLLSEVHPPARLQANTMAELVAHVRVGVCREVCIAQHLEAATSLPTTDSVARPDARWTGMFRAATPRMPRSLPGWLVEARSEEAEIVLRITPRGIHLLPEGPMTFFPEDQGIVAVATSHEPRDAGEPLVLRLPDVRQHAGTRRRVRGVLVARSAWEGAGSTRALVVDIPVHPDPGT